MSMSKFASKDDYYVPKIQERDKAIVELQAKNAALAAAMTGWQGYCKRNGVYVDDVQEFFDEALKERADE